MPPKINAQLPGATTLAVQDLCPLRIVDHLTMLIDAAAFALAIDALKHGGHSNLQRTLLTNPLACTVFGVPGLKIDLFRKALSSHPSKECL